MKYLKSFILFILCLIVSVVIFSTFSYFDITTSRLSLIIILIFVILGSLVSGLYTGTNTKNKGYLEGLKQGSINALVMCIFTLLFSKIKITSILYYLLIIGITTLGSVIGINKKGKSR